MKATKQAVRETYNILMSAQNVLPTSLPTIAIAATDAKALEALDIAYRSIRAAQDAVAALTKILEAK